MALRQVKLEHEYERICVDVDLEDFTALSQHKPGETEDIHEMSE